MCHYCIHLLHQSWQSQFQVSHPSSKGEASYDWLDLHFPVYFLQRCSSREIYIESKINIKCQTYMLEYTTENKLLNSQKTVCQCLNVRQAVHTAVFMSSPLDHRQHSAPLQTLCTSARFTSSELSYSTKKSYHKLTLHCLLKK